MIRMFSAGHVAGGTISFSGSGAVIAASALYLSHPPHPLVSKKFCSQLHCNVYVNFSSFIFAVHKLLYHSASVSNIAISTTSPSGIAVHFNVRVQFFSSLE